MFQYTRLFDPVVFDPELLNIVQKAFDAAWVMHTSDYDEGSPFWDDARQILAKAIIDRAQGGERRVDLLKNHGLRELLRFRNRPMPCRFGVTS